MGNEKNIYYVEYYYLRILILLGGYVFEKKYLKSVSNLVIMDLQEIKKINKMLNKIMYEKYIDEIDIFLEYLENKISNVDEKKFMEIVDILKDKKSLNYDEINEIFPKELIDSLDDYITIQFNSYTNRRLKVNDCFTT